jgi:putative PIN family toxin of toxin-antitoxin system
MSHRVVLDTNVLVAAAYAPHSASRRIVEACLETRLLAVASLAIKREYEFILARAVRVEGYQDRLDQFLARLELVQPAESPRLVPDDPDDDKFLAAAAAGGAGWIVTNDRHLLALDPHGPIRIVASGRFAELVWGRSEGGS